MPSQSKQLMPVLVFSASLALRSKDMACWGFLSCLLPNRVKKYGFVPSNQTCDFNPSRDFLLMGVHPFEAGSQELRHLFGAEEHRLNHESFLSWPPTFLKPQIFLSEQKTSQTSICPLSLYKKSIKQYFFAQEKII